MRWTTVSTIGKKPTPRCQHTATWLNHKSHLVVIAGQSETVTLKDVWSLDCSIQPPSWKEEKIIEHPFAAAVVAAAVVNKVTEEEPEPEAEPEPEVEPEPEFEPEPEPEPGMFYCSCIYIPFS